jgi:hypothetical protein
MHMSNESGRHRLLALWLFLTIAAVGLAMIASSAWFSTPGLLTMGSAILASGAFCFLVVQFWTSGTRPSAVGASNARAIDYTFNDAVPAPVLKPSNAMPAAAAVGRHHAVPPKFEEDLVEFENAGPEIPTTLKLPTAFQVEAQADAEPVARQPWIEQTIAASDGPLEREFVPAVERRHEIVSGLPLLSQIFSEVAPRTAAPTPERGGKTRGQCGSCGTFLWAPSQRPIRLRCPKCGHVKTLTD